MTRSSDLIRLFGDLRYIVIDEIHTLMGSDRGNQIICLLARLRDKTGCLSAQDRTFRNPRRHGQGGGMARLGKRSRHKNPRYSSG